MTKNDKTNIHVEFDIDRGSLFSVFKVFVALNAILMTLLGGIFIIADKTTLTLGGIDAWWLGGYLMVVSVYVLWRLASD